MMRSNLPGTCAVLLAALLVPTTVQAQDTARQTPSSARALESRARSDAVPEPGAAGPALTLAEVLASARFHAPQVLEALARVRGAQGRILTTQGAFDTIFSADADTRPTGFYTGSDASLRLTQPLAGNGGSIYGGYDIASGTFPSYEGRSNTTGYGRLTAGTVFSLMRDRLIDERRTNRQLAEADLVLAQTDQLLVAIGVQTRAIQAYNSWAIAGQRLGVFQGLLQLALDRQAGLKRQVTEGLRPAILLTENEQNILRRQTLVVQAEQQLQVSATALSLFLRGSDGQPVVPGAERLPRTLARPMPLAANPETLVARRPDLKVIDIRVNQARQRLALDRNLLLPKFDIKAEVNQFLGDAGAGGRAFTGTESKVGISFSLPLQQRVARGRIAQTNADIDAFAQRRRLLEDQITADIQALSITAAQAQRLLGIAIDEQDRAQTMAGAERRRFGAGASDFFLVNLREEAAADAQVRRLDAAFRQIVAHADLAAATADLDALGL
ncbi:TolC family protein [Sandarakinorhabdus sp.]|uniref:TolC family protein n=1 Tax=Sandarakinorhabdus sp. TaxID=1916663 RepID=UPI00286E1417|nr:TolC family protein [Sandarakinorhabdus sp.]